MIFLDNNFELYQHLESSERLTDSINFAEMREIISHDDAKQNHFHSIAVQRKPHVPALA